MKVPSILRRWLTVLACASLSVVWAGCGGSSTTGPGPTPQAKPLSFDTFQPASVVVGQPDMTSRSTNAGGSVGALGVASPYGAGAGSYWLADPANNRVLYFGGVPSSNGASAGFVLGQSDFTSNTTGISAQTFTGPVDCVVSGGKLFVADSGNGRVLIWNRFPLQNKPANVVVGQADFTSRVFLTNQTRMKSPQAMCVAAGKLFVADYENRRVLIWNSIPTTNSAPADVVVGQPDFTTSTTGLTASKLGNVASVWSDGQRLAVGDVEHDRVLIWNSIPTTNGAPADVVVGAPDFTTAGGGLSASAFGYPYGLASDGKSLFIADHQYSRVLIFTPFPTTNGASASGVLGQGRLTQGVYNDDNQDGTPDANPTARVMYAPAGLMISGDQLLVSDEKNNRVLIFKSK